MNFETTGLQNDFHGHTNIGHRLQNLYQIDGLAQSNKDGSIFEL